MNNETAALPTLFIANRGEIAVRVIRTARDLGYRTAVMYVDAESEAPYVELADHTVRVDFGTQNPFLDIVAVVNAAVDSGAGLVHPGYGFLSENADFAQAVTSAGMTWVGPSPSAIEQLGDKVSARAVAKAVGAPLAAGISHPTTDLTEIEQFAKEVGFPVTVKAAHGGGGRGMRIIRRAEDIEKQFDSARNEAASAFGRDECFVEQYLENPRHIETQCLVDTFGNISVIGTRDCSLQRRHQKLFEEAPAPGLSDEQLSIITRASRDILRHSHYTGAATCEFLLAQDGSLAFLEVNTRIQVEHTVTELVSGVDLIEQQLRIARGEEVIFPDNQISGTAFEFRINSEDPLNSFLPSTGTITKCVEPAGPWVRVDSGVRKGSEVTEAFDSMLAKLIVFGASRDQALARSRRALSEYVISGVRTVIPFFQALIEENPFRHHGEPGRRGLYTNWLESEFLTGDRAEQIRRYTEDSSELARDPGAASTAGVSTRSLAIRVDGREVVLELPPEVLTAAQTSDPSPARVPGLNIRSGQMAEPAGTPVITPSRGTVSAVHIVEGQEVVAGENLITIEVMKMEHTLQAPRAGTVVDVVTTGTTVIPSEPVARVI